MKAKRIAELKNAMAIARMNHDWLTASLICAELSAVIATASKPCSDQLRAELTANNIEMNRLTERNDAILSTLRERGLEPVRVRDDKPLTNEQLRAGGWWCDRTGGNRGALRRKNIDYVECQDTDGCYVFYEASCNSDVKEIIRKGSEFYYV